MQFISFKILLNRFKSIFSMMNDKTVPKRKKLLVILGIIYLFLPVDIIPPILFPFGFLDDLVLWLWILWHLKDTLDVYWMGEKEQDFSKSFDDKDIVEGVQFNVEGDKSEEPKDDSDTKH